MEVEEVVKRYWRREPWGNKIQIINNPKGASLIIYLFYFQKTTRDPRLHHKRDHSLEKQRTNGHLVYGLAVWSLDSLW
jgi:hypothetical protein